MGSYSESIPVKKRNNNKAHEMNEWHITYSTMLQIAIPQLYS